MAFVEIVSLQLLQLALNKTLDYSPSTPLLGASHLTFR